MSIKDTILFNADVAEQIGNEELLMPYLHACNVCCGSHAGSIEEATLIIKMAKEAQVKIGAHPSFPDRKNFGRIDMALSEEELRATLTSQIKLIDSITTKEGTFLHHVKLHGALYHKASVDSNIARIVTSVVKAINPSTSIMGLPNSVLESVCSEKKIPFLREGFADRAYNNDGSLVNRKIKGAVLNNNQTVLAQVKAITNNQEFLSIEGKPLQLDIDTICFHGDTKGAATLLQLAYRNIYG